ncbi:MAG: hypothetical protein BGN84_10925 [Afipia sp. 62-7]|nr:acyltransferase [Afipia sp.]OJU14937.1 MAG: hypothetical protein BGN84_10925 [Afipia sp. 62-7]
MQRKPELDGLRGLAALTVVVAHVTSDTKLWGGLLGGGGGQLGVMLFFALSGYLLGSIYLDQPFNFQTVGTYARHRIGRVVPLYYVVVIASFVLPAGVLYAVNTSNIVEHLFFARAGRLLWTIPAEMQFYAFFVVLWAIRDKSAAAFVAVCAAYIALSYILHLNAVQQFAVVRCLPVFLFGVLLSRYDLRRVPISPRAWSFAFVVGIALYALAFPRVSGLIGIDRSFNYGPFFGMWSDPIPQIAVVWLLATATMAPLATAMLANRTAVYLGTASYSMYLLHRPVIDAVKAAGFGSQPFAVLVLTIIGTAIVSTITYRLIERPFQKLIRQTVPTTKNSNQQQIASEIQAVR